MNWYKKANFNKTEPYYDSIGHSFYQDVDDNSTNFLWIFINNNIIVEDETDKGLNHGAAFNMDISDMNRIYRGRYESGSGRLSILKPSDGVLAFQDEPKGLRNKLYKKFLNITEIYEFN